MSESLPAAPPEPPPFVPVPTVPRHDGWTPERQRRFVAALGMIGTVAGACRAVGMSPAAAYKLRRHPDAASFAEAWDLALEMAADRLWERAVSRAVDGYTRPVRYRGKVVAQRHCYSFRVVDALDRRGR